MAPPNSVAIAAPIPTDYFGQAHGVLASLPTMYTWHGFAQPIVPVAHHDVDSTTLRPWPVDTAPGIPNPVSGVIGPSRPSGPIALPPFIQNLRSVINRGDFTNPLSWWRRQWNNKTIPEHPLDIGGA